MISAPLSPTASSVPVVEQPPSLQQQRDEARAAAARWRQRYEVEAKQRRQEAAIAAETIQNLRREVQQLCQLNPQSRSAPPGQTPLVSSNMASQPETLAAVQAECDRLAQALATEQAAHAQTRDNLISALGDALGRRPPGSSRTALPPATMTTTDTP